MTINSCACCIVCKSFIHSFLHLRQGWTRIAKAVNADTKVANRVIYDVLNEPDAFGLGFEPKNGKPGMRDLYLKSFDAIYAVNPGAGCSGTASDIVLVDGLTASIGVDGCTVPPAVPSQYFDEARQISASFALQRLSS